MRGIKISDQFLRFCLVGSIGFIVDAGVLHILVSGHGTDPYASRLFSYLLAASCTWVLNRHFTFRAYGAAQIHLEWMRYVTLNALGGAMNYATYALCLLTIDIIRNYPVLGVMVGSAVGLIINFSASKYLVFRTV